MQPGIGVSRGPGAGIGGRCVQIMLTRCLQSPVSVPAGYLCVEPYYAI